MVSYSQAIQIYVNELDPKLCKKMRLSLFMFISTESTSCTPLRDQPNEIPTHNLTLLILLFLLAVLQSLELRLYVSSQCPSGKICFVLS